MAKYLALAVHPSATCFSTLAVRVLIALEKIFVPLSPVQPADVYLCPTSNAHVAWKSTPLWHPSQGMALGTNDKDLSEHSIWELKPCFLGVSENRGP